MEYCAESSHPFTDQLEQVIHKPKIKPPHSEHLTRFLSLRGFALENSAILLSFVLICCKLCWHLFSISPARSTTSLLGLLLNLGNYRKPGKTRNTEEMYLKPVISILKAWKCTKIFLKHGILEANKVNSHGFQIQCVLQDVNSNIATPKSSARDSQISEYSMCMQCRQPKHQHILQSVFNI